MVFYLWVSNDGVRTEWRENGWRAIWMNAVPFGMRMNEASSLINSESTGMELCDKRRQPLFVRASEAT